tara:strand:+ start:839 stop:1177 length:339 start_codon:yes stop_codon:yes gene_type:complete
MIWPPLKAWTSCLYIEGQVYFVAINYGGELLDRWVVLMSVIDSNVVIKVSWSELLDTSIWRCGWDETNYSIVSKIVKSKFVIRDAECASPSFDSGLTVPITDKKIRPWFGNI